MCAGNQLAADTLAVELAPKLGAPENTRQGVAEDGVAGLAVQPPIRDRVRVIALAMTAPALKWLSWNSSEGSRAGRRRRVVDSGRAPVAEVGRSGSAKTS